MDGIPSWLRVAFNKRIDTIGQYMHMHPRHQVAWAEVSELLDKLQSTLSDEQRQAFGKWEDKVGLQESKEKEELYLRGLLDGIQIYTSIYELMDEMAYREHPHTDRVPPISK